MRVFVAALFTETNTFAPSPTGMAGFDVMGIRRGDGSGSSPAFDPAMSVLEALAAQERATLVPGLLAIAQPNGTVPQRVYEQLRDELLYGLRAVPPVDAVVLLLHGAMVAERCDDCEGDLLEQIRSIVGPAVAIGATLDLHCHVSERMRRHADVLVAYKEYPHTDALARLREAWRLTLDTALARIQPVTAVVDCRMTGLWPTNVEPMKKFVADMQSLEGQDGVLSVSFGHGFPWGDVADAGAKVWVVTDGDPDLAAQLAAELAHRIWDMRDFARPHRDSIAGMLDRLHEHVAGGPPLVIADVADNAGGGASSDSTFILRALMDHEIDDVVVGAFWDPVAAATCHDAGEGARLRLRLGGKCGPASGEPLDLSVSVMAVREEHSQATLSGGRQACGLSVWLRTDSGHDVVVISIRQQVLSTDLFTGLGIALESKRAIVVKSSQHFLASFGAIAKDVLYVDTPGLLNSDFSCLAYAKRSLNFWPRVAVPDGGGTRRPRGTRDPS